MTGGMIRETSDTIGMSSGGVGGSSGEPTSQCWRQPVTTGFSPGARAAHSTDVIAGNRVYVFGGWKGMEAINDLFVLETEKMVWKELKLNNPPHGRNNVRHIDEMSDQ